MNILFLSELFYPHGGGAELATYFYAKLLSEVGVNVVVITNRFAGEQECSKRKNLVVYRMPLFENNTGVKYSILRRFDILFSSFMKKLMKWADVIYIPRLWYSMIPVAKVFKKPVIVHVHDYTPVCPLAVLYDSSKRTVCENKYICSARCIYQFERNKNSNLTESFFSVFLNLFANRLFKIFIEQADAILCVSKAQRDILSKRLPQISHKTQVIYNPLPDLSPIDINGDDFGYFGGLNLLKGFGVLYDALAFLNDPTIKVHVTGLLHMAEKTMTSSHVNIIFHKKLEYDDQEGFYKRIRGVIFPTIVPEPLPYVTAEAILRAKIVIASRIGGIPEQVRGCKGVFLFEAGDHHALAGILRYVKDLDKESLLDLGFQNREAFIKNFNNEATINEFLDITSHLI